MNRIGSFSCFLFIKKKTEAKKNIKRRIVLLIRKKIINSNELPTCIAMLFTFVILLITVLGFVLNTNLFPAAALTLIHVFMNTMR